jgi:endonuclease-3
VLSHRTTHADEELAYDRMLEAFGDWAGVEAAPTAELAHAIRTTRWPDTQAPRIQEILRRIKAERGEFALDFLAEWPTDKAMSWLHDMPGIGLKTASLVLLFNFHKPVLPVDTHVHRIAQRVLVPPRPGRQFPAAAGQLLTAGAAHPKHNYWHGQKLAQQPGWPAALQGFCNYYLEHHGPIHPVPPPSTGT